GRLAPGEVPCHPFEHELVQLRKRAGALAVAEVMLPPLQIRPQPSLAARPVPPQAARRAHQLADTFPKLPTRLLTRPTEHPTAFFRAPGQAHAAMVKAEEVEPFLPVIHHPRLVRVQRQP